MKNFSIVWRYYSRKDVQKAILDVSKDREVVGVYSTGNFDKRPNVLMYPEDILQMVKKGIVSFHGSVERWSNPMALEPGMLRGEMDKLRIGWDLIIDPDCPDFEIAKLAVKTIVRALEDHGVKSYSIKMTGGKSFHIGLAFESFPKLVNGKPIENLYPEVPRTIIEYLKDYTREELRDELLGLDNPLTIAKRVGKSITEVADDNGLDPFKIVQIDSMMLTPRHMFRLPFAIHEKTFLVSVPVKVSKLDTLRKEDADPLKVKVETNFLIATPRLRDANALVMEALDWFEKHKAKEVKNIPYTQTRVRMRSISKKYFPPCIQRILQGLPDGRKRSVFILINFLRNMGWTWERIENELDEWNKKNTPPLPVNYLKTQIRWHKRQKRNLLPPNCDNENFYSSIGVCAPDRICNRKGKVAIKNPVNYPFRIIKRR